MADLAESALLVDETLVDDPDAPVEEEDLVLVASLKADGGRGEGTAVEAHEGEAGAVGLVNVDGLHSCSDGVNSGGDAFIVAEDVGVPALAACGGVVDHRAVRAVCDFLIASNASVVLEDEARLACRAGHVGQAHRAPDLHCAARLAHDFATAHNQEAVSRTGSTEVRVRATCAQGRARLAEVVRVYPLSAYALALGAEKPHQARQNQELNHLCVHDLQQNMSNLHTIQSNSRQSQRFAPLPRLHSQPPALPHRSLYPHPQKEKSLPMAPTS